MATHGGAEVSLGAGVVRDMRPLGEQAALSTLTGESTPRADGTATRRTGLLTPRAPHTTTKP